MEFTIEFSRCTAIFDVRSLRFEFKLDGSAKEALMQIEQQQYAVPYLNDKRTVHKIGVNISSESRTVDEWLVVN